MIGEFGISVTEERLDEMLKIFLRKRIQQSIVFDNSKSILESLRKKGLILIIISGNDGIPSMKRYRIKKNGFLDYIGEDVKDRLEGIKLIMKKYTASPEEIIFIDDKPSPINEINYVRGITTVKVEFDGLLKLAWRRECKPNFRIKKIDEIETILK